MVPKSRKTKIVAFMAASIDGRISKGNRSKVDWTSREDWNFLQRSLKKFDAVVVGRNTYALAHKSLEKRNTIVFTSRPGRPQGNILFLDPARSDVCKILRMYKKVAILGGARVYDYFLERGLLDELYVTIEPVIFSAGIPMFTGRQKIHRLKLLSVKKLNKLGTLLIHYAN